jgi:N6-adenosine-specific RNA methylase IME4
VTALLRYDAACRALAEAKTIDEVRDVMGRADAVRVYARQAQNRQLENDAKIIRWRAIRRLGEMLADQPKAKGTKGQLRGTDESGGVKITPPEEQVLTLDDAGIDKNLAKLARRYAGMEGTSFERLVARCQEYADKSERVPLDILSADEKEARRATEAAAYAERTAVGCNVIDLEMLAAEGAQFNVIYADPPWEFKVYSGKGKDRSADRHYNTGGLDAIKRLPVAALAADNCTLLMWAVMPELPGALEVIKAWGFEYKTIGFTWIKQNKSGEGLFWGMGYWTRANAEVCLLATKGHPERQAKDVHQVLLSPVTEHSRKPDEFHTRIERLLRGPYLELYARREREGWTTWGNEIPRDSFAPTDASGSPLAHDEETGEIQESEPEAQREDPVLATAPVDSSKRNFWDDTDPLLDIPAFLRRQPQAAE